MGVAIRLGVWQLFWLTPRPVAIYRNLDPPIVKFNQVLRPESHLSDNFHKALRPTIAELCITPITARIVRPDTSHLAAVATQILLIYRAILFSFIESRYLRVWWQEHITKSGHILMKR